MAGSNFLSIDDVNQQLNKGLEDILKSDRFNELLEVMSKVNNYSLNNSIMIAMQKPQATMVQGFNAWKEMGRFVQKGEKGIKILAPIIKKMDMEKIDPLTKKPVLDSKGNVETEKKDVLTGFKIVHVYDISQTKGKEIPSVRDFINREMQDEEGIKRLYNDFFNHVKESYPIREDATDKGVGGYFSPSTNEIVISNTENDNDSMKFRVLIHEYAHAKLHNKESEMKDLDRGHKEAQAESVAYIVSKYYGLDTDHISLGYIATWSQDIELARRAINEVQEVANEMIVTIDELQRDKIQEFYMDNNKEYIEAVEYLKNGFQIDVQLIDKSSENITQFELLNKESGMVVSARLDYSEKVDKFQLKTDKNWIIPLSEISPKGDYYVLNKELENGKLQEIEQYKRVSDLFQVQDLKNSKYVVSLIEGNLPVSKEFETKGEAEKHYLRLALSQTLHQESFLKHQEKQLIPNKELESQVNNMANLNDVKYQINFDVGKYLTHGTSTTFIPKDNDGSTIGWALMKNRNITNLDELKDYAFDKTKNLPSNKKLREALSNSEEFSLESTKNESSKDSKQSENVELER